MSVQGLAAPEDAHGLPVGAADNTLPTGLTIHLRHAATLFGEVAPDWFLVDDPSEVADLAVGEVARDPA